MEERPQNKEYSEDDAAARRARAEALRQARDVRNARVHGHAVPARAEPRDEATSRENQAAEEDTETGTKPLPVAPFSAPNSSAPNYVDLIDARMQQLESEDLPDKSENLPDKPTS